MCLMFSHYLYMQQYFFHNWAFGYLTLEPSNKPIGWTNIWLQHYRKQMTTIFNNAHEKNNKMDLTNLQNNSSNGVMIDPH